MTRRRPATGFLGLALCLLPGCDPQRHPPDAAELPPRQVVEPGRDRFEDVAFFFHDMPTGVAVSKDERIFVCFPRWGDPVDFTVAEIRNGRAVAYPDAAVNRLSTDAALESFVSVQSVIIDTKDRLWLLDTGSTNFAPPIPGGAKLVGIDPGTDKVFKTIPLGPEAALATTALNDVRFDLTKGTEGVAYITDSSDRGPNAIIVVDLHSGTARRCLNDHPSTKAEPGFVAFVDGIPLVRHKEGSPPEPLKTGCDGIALTPDGSRLYYSALAGRRLYSIGTGELLDASLTEEQRGAAVRDEGMKPASDRMEFDAKDRLYLAAYEHGAIVRRHPDRSYDTLICDPCLLWPDTISIAPNGWLYVISNQLHRQPDFRGGRDFRMKPYRLFRIKLDAAATGP